MPSTLTRRVAALTFSGALLFGVAACGDDGGSDDQIISDEQQEDINQGGQEIQDKAEELTD